MWPGHNKRVLVLKCLYRGLLCLQSCVCQMYWEQIDYCCYLEFKHNAAARMWKRERVTWVIDTRHVCHTSGDWERPCSQSGRSLSVCHTAAWRLLPLRQSMAHAHTSSWLKSLRNAYPSQSIGGSIGDQLAIPCNQYNPCCTAVEVPQWLWHLIKLLIAVLSFLR